MRKPKMAQAWYDDPEGTYERRTEELMDLFRRGVISGSECGMGRGVAEKCRAEALAARSKD